MQILYQDSELLVVNKPSGLLVHPSPVDKHERDSVAVRLADELEQKIYTVHRLDKPTSGLLVVALGSKAAKFLTEEFAQKRVSKKYLAVVRGYTPEHEVIDYPLKEQLDKMTDRQVDPDKPAQQAITEYERLATIELPFQVSKKHASSRYSLIKLIPQTGRKHQIRRHMHHIFHPIVGDTKHGDGRHNKFFRQQYNCHRLLLHAYELTFTHPVEHRRVTITAPLDETWQQLMIQFNWQEQLPY